MKEKIKEIQTDIVEASRFLDYISYKNSELWESLLFPSSKMKDPNKVEELLMKIEGICCRINDHKENYSLKIREIHIKIDEILEKLENEKICF